jgi:hypothetical protein
MSIGVDSLLDYLDHLSPLSQVEGHLNNSSGNISVKKIFIQSLGPFAANIRRKEKARWF